MLTEKIVCFLRGSASFRVREVFADAWVDACARRGVALRGVRRAPGALQFETYASEKNEIFALGEAYGAQTELLGERGLPYLMHGCKRRIGVPLGLILFFAIHLFLSGIVWSVEVEGLSRLDPEPFCRYLAEVGARPGAFAATVDCDELRLYAEGYSEEIARATVNLIGSRLFIRITERVMPPELPDRVRYGNVVAAKDGEVLSADYFAGKGEVRAGDAVVKGQLLASGVVELANGKTEFLTASARVIARTKTVLHGFTARDIAVKKVTRRNNYALPYFFLGVQGSLQKPGNVLRLAARRLLSLRGGVLPIGYSVVREVRFTEETLTLSDGAAGLICFSDYAAGALRSFRNVRLVSCSEETRVSNGVGTEGVFVCEEDIAKEEPYYLVPEP